MKYHSIEDIIKNNQAWVSQKLAEDSTYFDVLATGQKPPYLYIGCSDSRLALTRFTGTEPGELFVQTSIMRQALQQQKAPAVHGWVVNIHTGLIKDLQISTKQWQLRSLSVAAV